MRAAFTLTQVIAQTPSLSDLKGYDGALVMIVEAAAQHGALLAELAILPIKEKVLLVMGLPVGVPELVRHPVMRLLAGQPQLNLHLQRRKERSKSTTRACRIT